MKKIILLTIASFLTQIAFSQIFTNDCSNQTATGWAFTSVTQNSGYWLLNSNSDYVVSETFGAYSNLVLTSNLRSYGSGTFPSALIEVSTDGGATWTGVSTTHASIPNTYTDYTFNIGTLTGTNNKIRWRRSAGTRGLRINEITLTGSPLGSVCAITDIAIINPQSCNDNSTPANTTDDYYTADVTITYANAPVGGTITLSGADIVAGGINTATVASSPQTISGVRLKADNNDVEITASFNSSCTYTETVANSAVNFCSTPPPSTCGNQGGLMINEFSNGLSGTQEYIELLVLANPNNPTAPVDLTGWIIDDNNGAFGTNGIATGHIRLSAAWNAVNPGSLIVVYNNQDRNPAIPPDDPTDTNGDNIYIVPANHSSIETATGNTNPACPNNVGTPATGGACGNGSGSAPITTYNNNTFTAGYNNAWNAIGYRNGGDAAQVLCPNGDLFHALTYGDNNTNNVSNAVYTSPASGSGQVYTFTCNSMYYNNAYSPLPASSSQTPGAPNDTDNTNLVNAVSNGTINYTNLQSNVSNFSCGEVLATNLLSFNAILNHTKDVNLTWAIATKENIRYFSIERSKNGKNFETITTINNIQQNKLNYHFIDHKPLEGISYYRLKQINFENQFFYSKIKAIENHNLYHNIIVNIYPNPAKETLYIELQTNKNFTLKNHTEYFIYTQLGKMVQQGSIKNNKNEINIALLPNGVYRLKIANALIDKSLVFIKK